MITFLALAHMVGAMQTSCYLHLHAWLVLRNIMFLALAHMVGATQHHVSCTCTHGRCYATSWGGVGLGWGGDDNVPCTCTHGRCYATSYVSCTCTHGWCYATSCFLHLHTWLVLRNIMFLALAHMVGATQHHGVGLGWGWVGMIAFLALANMVSATQHHVCRC